MSFTFTQPISGSGGSSSAVGALITGSVAVINVPTITGSVAIVNFRTTTGSFEPISQSQANNLLLDVPYGQYRDLPLTATNLQYAPIQLDISGTVKVREQYAPLYEDNLNGVAAISQLPLAVSTYAWSTAFTTVLTGSILIKTSSGVFRSLSGRLDAALPTATYFFQLYNSASIPPTSQSAVAMIMAPVKIVHTLNTDNSFSIDATSQGTFFSNGLYAAVSTTEFSFSIVTASAMSLTVQYK